MTNDSVGGQYSRFEGGAFDAIVIGSGVGGLGAAALLARHGGKRVLVLERHWTAGGFTHTFTRKGFEWDVGVHYIGDVHRERSIVGALFDHITDGRLSWAPVGDVYDTIVVGSERFEFVTGAERWRERMHGYFPAEGAAVDRYLEEVRAVAGGARSFFAEKAAPAPVAFLLGGMMRRYFLRHSDRTLGEVLNELTDDPLLKGVLAGQYGDYGLTPSRASFAVHALVVGHYLEGAAYPVGGSARIAAAIVPTIEAAGGVIVTRAEVERILVERGRAAGVRMVDGREIQAPLVISDVGVANTVRGLLPEGFREKTGLEDVVRRVGPSAAHVCLYVGLDGTDQELGLGRSNLWVYPGPDHDANLAAYEADPEAPLPLAFISFPSAKDPDFGRRCPGRSTIEVVGFAPYAWFERWRETAWGKRGEEYERLKERLAGRLLEALFGMVPQVRGRVAYSELSTPLSTCHFAGYERGEIYGLAHTPARFRERRLRPRTAVKGLYLTGQDVCTAGVSGALFGAVVAASAALGRNLMGKILAR